MRLMHFEIALHSIEYKITIEFAIRNSNGSPRVYAIKSEIIPDNVNDNEQ